MLKAFQRRFIFAVMGSLLAVFLVLIAGINAVNYRRTVQREDASLESIAENGGVLPKDPPKSAGDGSGGKDEGQFELRYFTITGSQSREQQDLYLANIATVSADEARGYLENALNGGRKYGYVGNYRYYAADTGDDYMVVFMYCGKELQAVRATLRISVLVGLVSYLAVLLLVLFSSKRIMKPFIANVEKQKQFITDASHEIRTPLGIISANNDVLTMQYGENEWLDSSRRQTERLSGLVDEMIALSRLDEETPAPAKEVFCFSDAVLDVAADFEGRARAAGKRFDLEDVETDISLRGDEAALRRLVSILLDNALKYSDEGAAVTIRLFRRRKTAVLEVSNPCAGLDAKNLGRLFDRFYRADLSRAENGGYGLGLSIAQGLAESHGGKLSARSPDGRSVTFAAEL